MSSATKTKSKKKPVEDTSQPATPRTAEQIRASITKLKTRHDDTDSWQYDKRDAIKSQIAAEETALEIAELSEMAASIRTCSADRSPTNPRLASARTASASPPRARSSTGSWPARRRRLTVGMTIETVPTTSLTSDPRNARLHGEKNMASIVESLKRFGQQKLVVVDADGVVLAGNGMLAAAKQLAWPTIQIQRSHLRGDEARAFAIADNRTAELADWDLDELNRTLSELDAAGIDAGMLAFSDDDLAALADGDFDEAHGFAPKKVKTESEPEPETITPVFKIIITCRAEDEQAKLIRYLKREGAEFTAPSV